MQHKKNRRNTKKTENSKQKKSENTKHTRAGCAASGFDLKMEWYLNKNLVAYLRAQARAGSNLSCSLIVTEERQRERERGAVSAHSLSLPPLILFSGIFCPLSAFVCTP